MTSHFSSTRNSQQMKLAYSIDGVRTLKRVRKIDLNWLTKYRETFDLLRETLESIIASGTHPDTDELAAYVRAESEPLSQTIREYIAATLGRSLKKRGRPQTRSVGDKIVREWCREIYKEVYELAKRTKEPDAAVVARDRVAQALNISSATVGRWVATPKSRIRK